jgi:hypothetical protein
MPEVEQGMLRRAMLGASVGNCVEWFDFAVYGYLATTLGAVFFPSDDPTISLLSSFAIFGGAAPFFATYLISLTGNLLSPAIYLIAAAVASLITIATIAETARTQLKKT